MIDQQQQTDHAEHTAVDAEQAAERASERAHLDLQSEYVRRLRELSTEAHDDAQQSLARFAEEVRLRLAPNVHRYELLARQQHTALLAATVAAILEATHSYELLSVASIACEGYRVTHAPRVTSAPMGLDERALASAVSRVLGVVAETVAEDRARFAAEAETQHAVEQHEQDLADLDRDQ